MDGIPTLIVRYDGLSNLNVNPNPGWCWDGHLAKMCSFSDMDYAQMLEAILDAAAMRIGREYSQVGVE